MNLCIHTKRTSRLLLIILLTLVNSRAAVAQTETDSDLKELPDRLVLTDDLHRALRDLRSREDGQYDSANKLDSVLHQLIAVENNPAVEMQSLLPDQIRDDTVQVQIITRSHEMDRVSEAVRQAGGEVTGAGFGETIAQAWVPVSSLLALAEEDAIQRIRHPSKALNTHALPSGSQTSEALDAMNVGAWHAVGHRGSGIRVGVIDGGFRGYIGLLGSDLPTHVTARTFVDYEGDAEISSTGSEHGTACAEIIHDVAPDAVLYLAKVATAVDFEEAVRWLIAQQVDVISASIGWVGGTPGDGSGYQASVVQAAHDAGILWVNAAGNHRLQHWGGMFRDTDGNGLHEFSGGGEEWNDIVWLDGGMLPLEAGQVIRAYLRWDDWETTTEDYDLLLVRYDLSGLTVVAASTDRQVGSPSDWPVESVLGVTSGAPAYYALVIGRYAGTRSANLDLFVPEAPRLGINVPARSLATPADAAAAMAVAAVHSAPPYSQEPYSSEGPTNGAGGGLHGGIEKPAIAAYANIATVTYGSCGGSQYCFNGTSSAAPHVSGAAALVKGALPGQSPDQLRHFLQSRAMDLGSPGYDTQYGYGRLVLGAPPSPRTPSWMALPLIQRNRIHPSRPIPTPLPTATATRTPSPTDTAVPIPTPDIQKSPTPSVTPTSTSTTVASATPTRTASPPATRTATPSNTPTSTPSPTTGTLPTIPPPPTTCATSTQVVRNPSFETTSDWYALAGSPRITTATANTGSHSALVGGYNDALDGFGQWPLEVPAWAERGALYFSFLMVSEETTNEVRDVMQVQVWDDSGAEGVMIASSVVSNREAQYQWDSRRVELTEVTSMRGTPLRVIVGALTDATNWTAWYVDDVRLVFSCGTVVP